MTENETKYECLFVDETRIKRNDCVYFCVAEKSVCRSYLHETPHFDSVANLFQVGNVASVVAFDDAENFVFSGIVYELMAFDN